MAEADPRRRISAITLDERLVSRRSPEIEHERRVAIYDLLENNCFSPEGCPPGPYRVHLAIEETRLILNVRNEDEAQLERVALPLQPFRRLIKEYFLICESYYDAIRNSAPSKIEAIDMGRRGLHDEGAQLLAERLARKVDIDHPTARRLFTLICVLHIRA